MAGRPENASRANAALMGDKTYIGSVHDKCGTNERYTKGGGCVHCARVIATEQREARKYLQTQLDKPKEDGLDTPVQDPYADLM